MATILLLSDDLLDSSRVTGPARNVGATVRTVRDSTKLIQLAKEAAPALVVLDLANPGLNLGVLMESLGELPTRPKVVAYGSHVDVPRLNAAREAGCDFVLPRSAFVERLETDLGDWIKS